MGVNLQPIVAVRQQLIRASIAGTLQLMVASEKDRAREQFSERLNRRLDELGEAPAGRGRAGWLARTFKVSTESGRKWLQGEAIPDQTHLAIIGKRLRTSPCWLLTGLGRMELRDDPELSAFEAVWVRLCSEQREEVLAFARFKLIQEKAPAAHPEVARTLKSG